MLLYLKQKKEDADLKVVNPQFRDAKIHFIRICQEIILYAKNKYLLWTALKIIRITEKQKKNYHLNKFQVCIHLEKKMYIHIHVKKIHLKQKY